MYLYGLEYGVRAPVFCGNLREQTGDNGLPQIYTNGFPQIYRDCRRFSTNI